MIKLYQSIKNATEKFVAAKTKRIEKFIRYFRILQQEVTLESKMLKEFEKYWETVHRKLDSLDLNQYLKMNADDVHEKVTRLKSDLMESSFPLLQKLHDLEIQMQKKVISHIASIITKRDELNTNDLINS